MQPVSKLRCKGGCTKHGFINILYKYIYTKRFQGIIFFSLLQIELKNRHYYLNDFSTFQSNPKYNETKYYLNVIHKQLRQISIHP